MTIGATRNTMRKTTSLERSIVLEPTKKIQTGLLAVALGLARRHCARRNAKRRSNPGWRRRADAANSSILLLRAARSFCSRRADRL